jgi:hypothetical protein
MGGKRRSSISVLEERHEILLQDALSRLSADREDVELSEWEQTWPNTSCGFGGISGQALTTAPTVVVQHKETQQVVVYHANRFAYRVDKPSGAFDDAVAHCSLPGKVEPKSHLHDS